MGKEATTGEVYQKHAGHTGFNIKKAKDGRWLAPSIRKGLVNEA